MDTFVILSRSKWSTDRSNDFPRAVQPRRGPSGTRTQAAQLLNPCCLSASLWTKWRERNWGGRQQGEQCGLRRKVKGWGTVENTLQRSWGSMLWKPLREYEHGFPLAEKWSTEDLVGALWSELGCRRFRLECCQVRETRQAEKLGAECGCNEGP